MTITLTDRSSLVCQAIVDLLQSSWQEYAASIEDIFYGDQAKYARFPSISVEATPQIRELTQTGLQQRISFGITIMVYHGGLRTRSKIVQDADKTSEAVVDKLHTDRRLGGLIIHGNVVSNEPGAASRGGELLAANRILWEGLSNYTMPKS